MYDYYSKIYYEIKKYFIVKKMSKIKNKVRRFYEMKNLLTQRFEHVVV